MSRSERLDKVLSNSGFGSRKDVRRLFAQGLVSVNGAVVRAADAHVDTAADRITVDGADVCFREHRYVMMNKAAGYVCSQKAGAHETVFDCLPSDTLRRAPGGELQCVGRLDVDTEGLLLLTTDGALNHRLTSPKQHVPKTYLVYLRDAVAPAARDAYARRLAAGMRIPAEGKAPACDCRGAELSWLDEQDCVLPWGGSPAAHPAAACTITVYEGKFHEVRRLFAALGNEVSYLKRISLGALRLDGTLSPGQSRELSAAELSLLLP